MTEQQREIAVKACLLITAVFDQLMQPVMNAAQGIGEARQGIVGAQNALNRLLDQGKSK
jgi:hypothetical protein